MPFVVPVNTIAECLQTDCNILSDKKRLLSDLLPNCALYMTVLRYDM